MPRIGPEDEGLRLVYPAGKGEKSTQSAVRALVNESTICCWNEDFRSTPIEFMCASSKSRSSLCVISTMRICVEEFAGCAVTPLVGYRGGSQVEEG